jgi:hypothetical protein
MSADAPGDQSALLDPFDLPEWLASSRVVWEALESVAGQTVARVCCAASTATRNPSGWMPSPSTPRGRPRRALRPTDEPPTRPGTSAKSYCSTARVCPHWGVPTASFSADLTLEALRRFAKAVGSDPWRFAAHLLL